MSVHGICFDNGQSGRCNSDCEQFLDGECVVGDEIARDWIMSMTDEELELELVSMIEPVKLFTLRGSGIADVDLLIEEYGY